MGKLENLKPKFEKGNRFGKGRPKKLVSATIEALKAEGYEQVTKSNIVDAYTTLISLDESRLIEIEKDKSSPMILRLVADAILSKDGFDIVEKLLDRAHGKPIANSNIEVSGQVSTPTVISVRTEELDDFLEKLKEKENGRT